MDDPIAFFLTITCYGTWLPGDARGWIEYRHGWQLPDPARELEAQARMTDDACILTPAERAMVERQVAETCQHRGWILHTASCRSNHMHAVVSAPGVGPKKIRADIKAWCTRRLKELADPTRDNWWADRGSIRWIFNEEGLEAAILYVNEAQDRKHLDP
jgi:REP element-mobilizing transposase RayT